MYDLGGVFLAEHGKPLAAPCDAGACKSISGREDGRADVAISIGLTLRRYLARLLLLVTRQISVDCQMKIADRGRQSFHRRP